MKAKIKEISNLIFQCLQITEACGIKNKELDTRLWKVNKELDQLTTLKVTDDEIEKQAIDWGWFAKTLDNLINTDYYDGIIEDFVEGFKAKLQPKEDKCCDKPVLEIGGIPEHRFCSNCGADWKVNPNTEQKKQTNN